MSCCKVSEEGSSSFLGKACQPSKVIPIALGIIALIGLAAAGVGLAALGTQLGWWAVGTLSQLTQIQAIAMLASGGVASGVAGIATITGLAIICCKKIKSRPLSWKSIDSTTSVPCKYNNSEDFLKAHKAGKHKTLPPTIAASSFIPANIIEHLMKNKKNPNDSRDYESGDAITRGPAALHTLLTPICSTLSLTGDRRARPCVLSRIIYPLSSSALLNMVSLDKEKKLQGKNPIQINIPQADEGIFVEGGFDSLTCKPFIIYHLTKEHKFPAEGDANGWYINEINSCIENYLEDDNSIDEILIENRYIQIGEKSVFLEALFNVYKEQLQNEFKALDTLLPQGYVYILEHPNQLEKEENEELLRLHHLLQALAFRELYNENPPQNLKVVSCDFKDEYKQIWDKVLRSKKVLPKNIHLIEQRLLYRKAVGYDLVNSILPGLAYVEHSDSDGFRNTLGSVADVEDTTDEDIRINSDIACVLDPSRKDLLKNIIYA